MKYYIKLFVQNSIFIFLLPFYFFPIKKNRILFLSLEGGAGSEYSCNPKYFYEFMKVHARNSYEYVWLFSEIEPYSFLIDYNTKIAKHFSIKGFYYALTSKVVITNGGYLSWFPFRKNQLCINTWHGGGAYKKLENDMHTANFATKCRMKKVSKNTSLFLSNSEAFTNHLIKKAFLYNKAVLSCGSPRNDILFHKREKYKTIIHEHYSIPMNTNILLYAPTFRDQPTDYQPIDVGKLLDCLEASTHSSWIFCSKMHAKSKSSDYLVNTDHRYLALTDCPDPQELLCATDFLITDYSSILWDYAHTNNPCLLYVPDLKNYIESRGFYVNIYEWGFPLCFSNKDILHTLTETPYKNWILSNKAHINRFKSFEDGYACDKLLKWLELKLNQSSCPLH